MNETDKGEQWRARIEAWRASGLSQKAWCIKEGVTYSSFGYWRKRLRAHDSKASAFERVGTIRPEAQVTVQLSGVHLQVPISALEPVLQVVRRVLLGRD